MKIKLLSLIAKKMNVNGLKTALLLTALLMFGGVSFAQPWTEDFDDQTSGSYLSSFTCGISGTWTASQAGNFSLGTDRSAPSCVAINDDKTGAHITTPDLNTCGTVSFYYYARFGSATDQFELQVSENGGTFSTLDTYVYGGTTSPPYALYTYDVNSSASQVNIRVLNNHQDSHLIIDDFSVTAYSSCSGEPTDQATDISVSNETATTLDVSWSAGTGGDEYILVAREGSSVSWTPTDGTDYSSDTESGDFSAATDQSSGNKVVYAGSGTSTTITELSASTTYYFQVFHLCANDSDNYLTSTGTNNDGSQNGTTTAVSYCASSGNMSYGTAITLVQINTINNTTGAKANAYEDYTAQSTDLQQGNSYPLTVNLFTDGGFTIYSKVWIDWNQNGDFTDSGEEYDLGNTSTDGATSNSPLTVNVPAGASLGTTTMRVSGKYGSYATSCETGFDGEVEDYTINVIAPSTNDTDTEAYSGSQPAASDISSTSTAFANVFQIEIEDQGSGDGLVTDVTNIRVKPHSTNTADWTDHIADVKLNNGSDITIGSPTITDTYIDIPISAGNLQIADDGSDVITLQIQINNTGITDNAILSFMVDADDHGFTADASGSDFASEFLLGDFNSSDFTIDITGDEIRFTQQPTDVAISTAVSPDVTVAFTDANGNVDTDFTGAGCAIGLTTTGSFDGTATTQVDAVNGVATFDNLVFDAEATNITLTTTDPDGWGWTSVTSDQFDVTPVSYCDPAPTSGDGNGITNVTMGTIDNDSGQESGYYGDYSAQSTDVEQGATVNCDITYETGWTYVTKIWVDWNNDGDFDDSGEEVYSGTSLSDNPTTLSASFNVPAGATLGAHKLRIGGADSGPPTPCYTGSYASYEDYTINVISPGPTLTASPASLSGFTYEIGSGPSTEQSFDLTGSDLDGTDVTITPPTDYEISLTSGSGFQSTAITLSTYDGSSTPVYVRLKAGLAVGTYNGETIDVAGGGASAVSVSCDGEVTPIIIDSEDFGSCPPSGWTIYSVSSDENWTCGSGYMQINNYNADIVADDWLISPPINLDNYTNEILTFETYKQYADGGVTNPETKLYYSTDYSGSGDPSSSTWTSLTYNYPADDSEIWTASGDIDLSSITGSSVYFAFQHESSGTGAGSTSLWRMNNFEIVGSLATPCSAPANQPTALDLNDNTTYNSIDGSFTASSGTPAAHGYLVVRSTASSLSGNPIDGTAYTAGESLGGGTVVSSGSSTNFTATGLSESTQYYLFVFAYQNTACSGGPVYLTTSPLSGNETTTTGPDISLGSLTAFGNACVGTTAGPNSFTLSGTNLTTADITIAALTGYTYSTTAGGTYTSTLTISGHGGGTYNTTIYVKFSPIAATTYNSNITVSGAGITGSENCAASGTGLALPTITGTTTGSVCNSGTVNLSATASAGTMDWYNVASGGASLSTGENFTTPSISSTTSYWVDATDGNGCTSARTEVVATVNTTPAITSSLTASGTTGNAFSYFITGSYSPTSYNATGLPAGLGINTSTGEISGTPTATGTTNVTISATNACGTGSETLVIDITEFTYNAGDYRSTADAEFTDNNPTGTTNYWEYFDGSSWTTTPSDDGPADAGTTPGRVIINHNITCADNASNTYNDIIIRSGGKLTLTQLDNPPVAVEFINSGETIEVESGGELVIQGDIDLPSDGALIVRNGGLLTIDHDNMDNVHPIWDGVENFESGSTVKILDWDFGASATVASLVNFVNDISNNIDGYKFGNLIYDVNTGTEDWAVVGGSVGVIDLVYNDFTINNAGSGYIGGITNRTGTNGYFVNGDLIVNSGNFNFSATYNTDNFEHQAYINGDFEFNSAGSLYIHRNGFNTPDAMEATEESFVHFKGNITVNSAATFANDVATDNTRMYMVINGSGTEADPQLLDIGVTAGMTGIDTYINNNTFVQLASNDWIFNGISGLTTGITLETGSSLHFGWADDGTTPLTITMPGGAVGTNTITTETGTALYMTHAQGLDDGTNLTNGNVQQFAQANRSFNQTADFWYVGKTNQVTGNAITTASSNKLIGIDMSNSIDETTLTDDIITSGKLILKSGVLKTTSSELLSLEDNATVHTDADGTNGEPGSANSWVDGPLKKIGNDAFVFPLGETIWAPIGISAPSNATDEFTGEYFHEAYSDIENIDATLDRVSDIDYWDITRNNGSSLPTVTGYWKDDRYGISDIADVVIAHYVGGNWNDMGSNNASGATTNGSVQNSAGFTSFSPITLGFKDVLLPIELLAFNAKYDNDDVLVNWATASETNNDYFTIERSKNGKSFEPVTSYPGAGNSSRVIHYEITDYTPYAGESYYRLKQTDFDNTVSYSDIVSVSNINNNELMQVSVWRNENVLFVQAENVTHTEDMIVQIQDMAGRVLFVKRFDTYSENIQIDLANRISTKGIYTVTVIADEFYKTQKLFW